MVISARKGVANRRVRLGEREGMCEARGVRECAMGGRGHVKTLFGGGCLAGYYCTVDYVCTYLVEGVEMETRFPKGDTTPIAIRGALRDRMARGSSGVVRCEHQRSYLFAAGNVDCGEQRKRFIADKHAR